MTRPTRILGLFAHPDDEAFCMGGVLARYVSEGADGAVVSMTKGQAGQIRDPGLATRRTLAEVRAKELEAACAVLGVQSVRCLDYLDGTLADLAPGVLVDEAAAVLEEFRPDVVVTFGDDGAYGHPDHVAVSRATKEAFARILGREGPARLYHAHFPRSRLLLLDHLSSWLVDLDQRFKGPDQFVRALSLFAQESTTMRYAGDHIETMWAPTGTHLVEQGEPATSLHLILSGTVEVLQDQADGTVERLRTMGPGEFFGELGVASQSVRSANVVAAEPVTCLVFTADEPALFEGRGEDARLVTGLGEGGSGGEGSSLGGGLGGGLLDPATADGATTVVDVSDWVDRKIAAIAAHRTQFPIEPEMFPPAMLQDMFGQEFFVRVFPVLPFESSLLP
jgi:LmbE family N-acetylglucosaminyl deacetylase